jgi:predicted  nucleic acid-binding Zn-ribbon protein
MHPTTLALLRLHEAWNQYQAIEEDIKLRKNRIRQADTKLTTMEAECLKVEKEAAEIDALIRQYASDVDRCETQIASMRSQQTDAKTNRDYIKAVNTIEESRAEIKLRQSSLADLKKRVLDRQTRAQEVRTAFEKNRARHAKFIADNQVGEQMIESAGKLKALYDMTRSQVAPEYLEVYERLTKSNCKTPLIAVHPETRATSVGIILSHHQMEILRSGQLLQDRATNGIFYLRELDAAPAEARASTEEVIPMPAKAKRAKKVPKEELVAPARSSTAPAEAMPYTEEAIPMPVAQKSE